MGATCKNLSVAFLAGLFVGLCGAEAKAAKSVPLSLLGCWKQRHGQIQERQAGLTVCFGKAGKVTSERYYPIEREGLAADGDYKVVGNKILFTIDGLADGWIFGQPKVQCRLRESRDESLVLTGCTDLFVTDLTLERTSDF